MATVTQRVKQVNQPRGGYINPRDLDVRDLSSNRELNPEENVSPSLVGMAVDYLTRYLSGREREEAFKISLKGAVNVGKLANAKQFLYSLDSLTDDSIVSACRLVGYDVAYRVGPQAYRPVSDINPNLATIENIREMVERSLFFFREYGPVIKDGFDLEGAYTDKISIGDGDFITDKTLWDFKVSKNLPKKEHILQLLVYYLMGRKSVHHKLFDKLEYLGIFNPRLNIIYWTKIEKIPKKVIHEVSSDVIGY